MSFVVSNIRVSEDDPTVVRFALKNTDSFPRNLNITGAGVSGKRLTSEQRAYSLELVTRRTTANPGESIELRLTLVTPVTDFPTKAQFTLSVYYGGYNAASFPKSFLLSDAADVLRGKIE